MSVAMLALVLSSGLAVWEFTKWALEGARVRVTLQAGHLHDYQLQQAATWASLGRMVEAQGTGGWPIEVAVIDVENAGRMAVTVSEVSFDLGRTRSQRFGFGRHTIGLHLLDAPGATTESTVRIEPMDRARFVIEARPALPAVRESQGRKGPSAPIGRVRASVRVAGRRRRQRSGWRRSWKTPVGSMSHAPGRVEIQLGAYRALWPHCRKGRAIDDHTEIHLIPFALAIAKAFPEGGPAPTAEQLEELFKKEWVFANEKPVGLGLLSLYAAKDLQMFYVAAEPEAVYDSLT
jgi:hypothetical protein